MKRYKYRKIKVWEDDDSGSLKSFSPAIDRLSLITCNILPQSCRKCMFMDSPYEGYTFKWFLHKTEISNIVIIYDKL